MTETKHWTQLTRRYGGGGRNPTPQDIAQAAAELVEENIAGMQEGDYAEHPNASLVLGSDDGPMYVVDAYRNGSVILSKYADQDDVDAVCELSLTGVSQEKLLAMWTCLASGNLAPFRSEYPACGW